MLEPELLQTFGSYLVQHPEELIRMLRNAALLKFGVPLAALRWAAAHSKGSALPRDVTLEAVPPGLRIGMTVEVMRAELRVSALIFIEQIRLDAEELRLELRVSEVRLSLLGASDSPLAALIQSGALDLSRIGNLVAVMPRRPAFLVEAKGERIVLDLKRIPALSGQFVESVLGLVTPLVTIKGVATDVEHLDVEFGVLSGGVASAVSAWKQMALATVARVRGGEWRSQSRE
jgi:hypothetical protein